MVKVPNNVGARVPDVDEATEVSWDTSDCRALDSETVDQEQDSQ